MNSRILTELKRSQFVKHDTGIVLISRNNRNYHEHILQLIERNLLKCYYDTTIIMILDKPPKSGHVNFIPKRIIRPVRPFRPANDSIFCSTVINVYILLGDH